LYSAAPHRKGTSNRRERGSARERMPHVIIRDRLESIRAQGKPFLHLLTLKSSSLFSRLPKAKNNHYVFLP
jgi:hypothetical protein